MIHSLPIGEQASYWATNIRGCLDEGQAWQTLALLAGLARDSHALSYSGNPRARVGHPIMCGQAGMKGCRPNHYYLMYQCTWAC